MDGCVALNDFAGRQFDWFAAMQIVLADLAWEESPNKLINSKQIYFKAKKRFNRWLIVLGRPAEVRVMKSDVPN
jgi:hypothetical protein